MKVGEARQRLSRAVHGSPAALTRGVLSKLTVEDVPDGASFVIAKPNTGRTRWRRKTAERWEIYLDWGGKFRREGMVVFAETVINCYFARKYWSSPLGLEQYLDLIRRAIDARPMDVELIAGHDDGVYVALDFRIKTIERNLARAYDAVRRIEAEIREVADQAVDEVGQLVAKIAARVSGWDSKHLNGLVNTVETAASTAEKGRALEELCSLLFSSVAGWTVRTRVRTVTEEIDISVVNGSDEPRLRDEGTYILGECKNWRTKCGKDEFVLFRDKMENRTQRCRLGFLISWNGFADTITSQMLRRSRSDILVVPLTGEDVRLAVRGGDFLKVLLKSLDDAVHT